MVLGCIAHLVLVTFAIGYRSFDLTRTPFVLVRWSEYLSGSLHNYNDCGLIHGSLGPRGKVSEYKIIFTVQTAYSISYILSEL